MKEVTLSIPEPLRQWIAEHCGESAYRANKNKPDGLPDFVFWVDFDGETIEYIFERGDESGLTQAKT